MRRKGQIWEQVGRDGGLGGDGRREERSGEREKRDTRGGSRWEA